MSDNIIYKLKLDQNLFEYRVKNLIIKALCKLLKFNTQVTIPLNQISDISIRKTWVGRTINLTITTYTNKRNGSKRQIKLNGIWLLNGRVMNQFSTQTQDDTPTRQQRMLRPEIVLDIIDQHGVKQVS